MCAAAGAAVVALRAADRRCAHVAGLAIHLAEKPAYPTAHPLCLFIV